MDIYLQLDQDGYVLAYGSYEAEGAIHLTEMPDLEYPSGFYRYIDGEFVLDEAKAKEYDEAEQARLEEPSEEDTILGLLADQEYRLCMLELGGELE